MSELMKQMVYLVLGVILGYNVLLVYFLFLHEPLVTPLIMAMEFVMSFAPWN